MYVYVLVSKLNAKQSVKSVNFLNETSATSVDPPGGQASRRRQSTAQGGRGEAHAKRNDDAVQEHLHLHAGGCKVQHLRSYLNARGCAKAEFQSGNRPALVVTLITKILPREEREALEARAEHLLERRYASLFHSYIKV